MLLLWLNWQSWSQWAPCSWPTAALRHPHALIVQLSNTAANTNTTSTISASVHPFLLSPSYIFSYWSTLNVYLYFSLTPFLSFPIKFIQLSTSECLAKLAGLHFGWSLLSSCFHPLYSFFLHWIMLSREVDRALYANTSSARWSHCEWKCIWRQAGA